MMNRTQCLNTIGSDYIIRKKVKNGELFRVGKSVYSDKSHVPELAVLRSCMDTYIFSDTGMRENNTDDILKRLNMTFSNRLYRRNIKRTEKANWLNIDPYDAFDSITAFFSGI